MKQCSRCKLILQLEDFDKDKSKKSGVTSHCKSCKKIYRTIYRAENLDFCRQAVRISCKKYRKNNPLAYVASNQKRRATLRSAKQFVVTKFDLAKILAKPCFYCGNKSTQIDHVVPLSRGGSHSIGNIVGSCETCNKQKGKLFIIEWISKSPSPFVPPPQ